MEYEYDNQNCDGKDGCPGIDVYTITGKKPGKVTITFTERYITNEVHKIAKYEITVDNNLNITENHSGSYFE